jgi:CTP synthase (UTP-ammonia lyase)
VIIELDFMDRILKIGITEAAHEERSPNGKVLFINKLNCSLAGKSQRVILTPNTKTQKAYNSDTTVESFRCNYGLNEEFRKQLEDTDMKITGLDNENKIRIIEIPNHLFFVIALFLPQLTSTIDSPHPLIMAFLKASVRNLNFHPILD